MAKYGIVIQGGAGKVDAFIKKNEVAYQEKLKEIVDHVNRLLAGGASAVDAVEEAVVMMEDTELFNCGRGAAIDANGEIKMEAGMMEGADLKSGGVGQVKFVKNPVKLARKIMEDSKHVLLVGEGAIDYARYKRLELMPALYFMSEYQKELFFKERDRMSEKELEEISNKGTVGAVALDRRGNLAAATSTGGVPMKRMGRLGDTALPGIGAYANNATCAASCTGDGEYVIRSVGAHYLSALIEMQHMPIQKACDYLIHEKNAGIRGDFGIIAISPDCKVGMAFNSERMMHAWKINNDDAVTGIYRKEK